MAACVLLTVCLHALAFPRPKYGRPCPLLSTVISSAPALARRRPMDDCQHELAHFHSLTRKRKVAADDDRSPPSAADQPAQDSLLLSPSATPRIPAKHSDASQASATWLLARHRATMIESWQQQQSPGASSSSASFAPHTRADGPSRPKRPRIEIPQSSRKSRRRVLYSSNTYSPRKLPRLRPTAFLRDTGVVSAVEPRRLSPLRTSITPQTSPPRSAISLPATPIEPSYAHVPSHQPPVNRDTLKELDLDAILRNPQLRQCTFILYLIDCA